MFLCLYVPEVANDINLCPTLSTSSWRGACSYFPSQVGMSTQYTLSTQLTFQGHGYLHRSESRLPYNKLGQT